MAEYPRTRDDSDAANITPSAASAIEPLPELETVTDADDLTLYGVLDPADDIEAALELELTFLAALLFAPAAIARQVITAVIGTRDESAPDLTVLPVDTTLFLGPANRLIFDAAVTLIDEGTPATPQLVQARLTDQNLHRHTKNAMLDIISPATPRATVVGGADLPHLAAALVDAWYRRGYRALVTRMHQMIATRPVDELGGHWTALTAHQQTAERRRLTVRDNLARI
ncbi:hypothetical protein GTV32_22840 [Gordonia sp. SID5947]|uniref:hypothetical protein n=1 Tax=Gordonia sp. SID5947 TaxID=2690315 RepID=UPI00137001A1|nr:hypothetical protein [Gordonia sp. SID5947]MYR08973.1 hypothetical protein [Gordonia sp. SID5947]